MLHESQLLLYIAAYLIGSIPFGLLLTRAAGMGDIRKIGSGNIGATNVLRAGGKKVAMLTLLLDAGKGYAAVILGMWAFGSGIYVNDFMIDELAPYYTGLCAILGHCFPIWLKFKGGKGVATAFGAVFALSSNLGLACLATWALVFAVSRYSSLSAIISMLLMPVYAFYILPTKLLGYEIFFPSMLTLFLISLLIILRHQSNIKNLLAGKEHKFGKQTDE